MPLHLSPIEQLPNEILDQIISYFSTDPPSYSRLRRLPSLSVASSSRKDLKNVSQASSRLLGLVRPFLFSNAFVDLQSEAEFLSFISQHDLARYVLSIVVIGHDVSDYRSDLFWWRRIFRYLDPLRITIIAPPAFIGTTLRMYGDADSWAFEIPLQSLHLRQDRRQRNFDRSIPFEEPSSLLSARTWTSFGFNEGSSLKPYNHYEYFHYKVPSIFNSLRNMESMRTWLDNLTSFHYVSVFPFYNHVHRVLEFVERIPNLQSFSVQLIPDQRDNVEIEAKGSMNPSDPWMEIESGYSIILNTLALSLGNTSSLKKFVAFDYKSLPAGPSGILWDTLDGTGWYHDGQGTWTRS